VRMRKRSVVSFLLCSLLSVVFQASLWGQPEETTPPQPLGKLVDVGGYRVHLYCIGTGSPTVVIVGAGYSFDWGLVQDEMAKSTQVCSYDHSGIGWSDDGPKDSCALRVDEVHAALKTAGVKAPYVLVGHSLGALVARVYAGRYPEEVAGMVFVDHAISFGPVGTQPGITLGANGILHGPPDGAAAPSGSQVANGPRAVSFGFEDDPNFSNLSAKDQELHRWFMGKQRDQKTLQANHEMMPQCFTDADAIVAKPDHPLGDKPVADVDTPGSAGAEIQKTLLSLSTNSKELVADKSGHFVIIDRPDVVNNAIDQVIRSVRNKTPL
jgi:pimeloyl-ACP methyl ester carboxylesterase